MKKSGLQRFLRKTRVVMQELWGESAVVYRGQTFTASFMEGDMLGPVEVGGVVVQPDASIRLPMEIVTRAPVVGDRISVAGVSWRILRVVARGWDVDYHCQLGKVGR